MKPKEKKALRADMRTQALKWRKLGMPMFLLSATYFRNLSFKT